MLIEDDVVENAPEVASSVQVPDTVRIRLVNVATPSTALTVSVPPTVPPFADDARLMVTGPLYEGTMLLFASRTATIAVNGVPAPTFAGGSLVNTSCAGGPIGSG